MPFAKLPAPPFSVVCFSSARTDGDNGFGERAEAMEELAREQPGFLGVESVRGSDGFGITNAYWSDEDSIRAWKRNVDHLAAQKQGRAEWYRHYEVRVARVERAYGHSKAEG